MCSFAIRESRIGWVVYGLRSPHMGGTAKWNVLGDTDLSESMPEVFAPPPEIVSVYMEQEVEQALIEWNPLIARRKGDDERPTVFPNPVHALSPTLGTGHLLYTGNQSATRF